MGFLSKLTGFGGGGSGLASIMGGAVGGPLGLGVEKFVNKQGGEFTTLLDPGDLLDRQKKKEKRRLRAIDEKRRKLDMSKQGVETLRAAQMERAKLLQLGANRGVQDSSAIQGGLGSIQSQAGANLGFANQIFALNQQASSRMKDLARWQSKTNLAMTVGSFFLGGIGGAAAGAASGVAGGAGVQGGQSPPLGSKGNPFPNFEVDPQTGRKTPILYRFS